MIYQRLFGLILLLLCIFLGVIASSYHAPFSYEPVGPRAYPMLLLILMGLGAIYIMLRPASPSQEGHGEPPLNALTLRKIGLCVVIMLAYASLFESLGFIPSSLLFGIAMARLYDGKWSYSVIAGVVLSIGLYYLFDKALDVPLPLGILATLEN